MGFGCETNRIHKKDLEGHRIFSSRSNEKMSSREANLQLQLSIREVQALLISPLFFYVHLILLGCVSTCVIQQVMK